MSDESNIVEGTYGTPSTNTPVQIRIRYPSGAANRGSLEASAVSVLRELLEDLGIEVRYRIATVPTAPSDLARANRFELAVSDEPVRTPVDGPPLEDDLAWRRAIGQALFDARERITRAAFVGLSQPDFERYVAGARLGYSRSSVRQTLERHDTLPEEVRRDEYSFETLLAERSPRTTRIHVARALYGRLVASMNDDVDVVTQWGSDVANDLIHELGIRIPRVELVPSEGLSDDEHRISLRELRGPVQGTSGDAVTWMTLSADELQAELLDSLRDYLRRHGADLLSTTHVEAMLNDHSRFAPMQVFTALERYSLVEIARVLQDFVRHGISIRDLGAILEVLLLVEDEPPNLDFVGHVVLPAPGATLLPPLHGNPPRHRTLSEACRIGMAEQVTDTFTRGRPELVVHVLSPQLEAALAAKKLTDEVRHSVVRAVRAAVGRSSGTERRAVLLTHAGIRWRLQEELLEELPHVHVVSYSELDPTVRLAPVSQIDLPDPARTE